jgi:hypothetical protein
MMLWTTGSPGGLENRSNRSIQLMEERVMEKESVITKNRKKRKPKRLRKLLLLIDFYFICTFCSTFFFIYQMNLFGKKF